MTLRPEEHRRVEEEDTNATNIWTIRHAPTAFNEQGRLQGNVDTDILPSSLDGYLGKLWLTAVPTPHMVAVSGLRRTAQTAQAIMERYGWDVPVTVRPQLNERTLGPLLEGKTHDEIRTLMLSGAIPVTQPLELVAHLEDLSSILEEPSFKPPGGESMIEVGERMRQGLIKLREEFPKQNVFMVNHYAGLKSLGLDVKGVSHLVVAKSGQNEASIRVLSEVGNHKT
jgi:broad specificity phosphatase PhoE